MKKSKLLFLTPCVAMATIMPIASCGGMSENEKVAHAIFDPANLNPDQPIAAPVPGDFYKSLQTLNNEEIKNELIYDLFIEANAHFLFQDVSLKQLYEQKKLSLTSNITKALMEFKDEKIYATFLGYVSFIFIEDIPDSDYKINDYVMLTYDFKDLEVATEGWGLEYDSSCLGFYKYRTNGGEKEWLEPITNVRTKYYSSLPPNSHNWGDVE